ncbi:unnamed protein product [Candidatus Paraburkholderia kirkii UZHbot1]|uniref:WGS project CAFE00000000 data, contig bkir_c438 n=1 Tax=Candidatus Paraburkholderia kirkii UZHbot1 TaxID=1055526 RepID=U3UAZ2_9BURK|nr:unnamed protein product [Candidatus Paraburkholderia kirkii UZHbot1]
MRRFCHRSDWRDTMDDDAIERAAVRMTRRPRQGEACWREMVEAWRASGVGARCFCRAPGLAVSTFRIVAQKVRRRGTCQSESTGRDGGRGVCHCTPRGRACFDINLYTNEPCKRRATWASCLTCRPPPSLRWICHSSPRRCKPSRSNRTGSRACCGSNWKFCSTSLPSSIAPAAARVPNGWRARPSCSMPPRICPFRPIRPRFR